MKTKTLFAIFHMALAIAAMAQPSYQSRSQPERQDLRVVEGKLYDASKSVLWKSIQGQCIEVRTNGVLLEETVARCVVVPNERSYSQSIGAYSGGPVTYTESQKTGNKLFVRNYPLILRPTVGKAIYARVLPAGTTNIDHQKIELLDYGTGYIPPHPISAPRAAGTNSPATNAVASTP